MVAETSAWGRAIVAALAADTKRGVASADEVRARRAEPERKGWTPELQARALESIRNAPDEAALDKIDVYVNKQDVPEASLAEIAGAISDRLHLLGLA